MFVTKLVNLIVNNVKIFVDNKIINTMILKYNWFILLIACRFNFSGNKLYKIFEPSSGSTGNILNRKRKKL